MKNWKSLVREEKLPSKKDLDKAKKSAKAFSLDKENNTGEAVVLLNMKNGKLSVAGDASDGKLFKILAKFKAGKEM
jgi:3-dehydroquinate synthetase